MCKCFITCYEQLREICRYMMWEMRCEIWDFSFEIWALRYVIWDVRYEIWDMRYEIWGMRCEVRCENIYEIRDTRYEMWCEVWDVGYWMWDVLLWDIRFEIWIMEKCRYMYIYAGWMVSTYLQMSSFLHSSPFSLSLFPLLYPSAPFCFYSNFPFIQEIFDPRSNISSCALIVCEERRDLGRTVVGGSDWSSTT